MIKNLSSRSFYAGLRLTVFALISSASLLTGFAQSAEPAIVPFGTYELDRHSIASMEQALSKAAAQFGGMQRQLALRRLRERMVSPDKLELAHTDGGLVLQLGESRFPAMQPGEKPITWKNKEGKDAQVALKWHGSSLVHEVTTDGRTRQNTLTFDPVAKILRLEVRIHGQQLRHPVTFTLRYLPTS